MCLQVAGKGEDCVYRLQVKGEEEFMCNFLGGTEEFSWDRTGSSTSTMQLGRSCLCLHFCFVPWSSSVTDQTEYFLPFKGSIDIYCSNGQVARSNKKSQF